MTEKSTRAKQNLLWSRYGVASPNNALLVESVFRGPRGPAYGRLLPENDSLLKHPAMDSNLSSKALAFSPR